MHKIVFLDRETLAPDIDVRRPDIAHTWTEYDRTAPGQVAERLAGATIAISNKVPVDADALAGCPDLKMIAVAATGVDMVDVAACRERGIVVSNVRGYAETSVPEHTFALILALKRAIIGYRQDVADGLWQKSPQFCLLTHRIGELRGGRLGIVGNGSLGTAVAAIGAKGFGMEPVFLEHASVTDEKRETKTFLPFAEFMATSDVITVHSPLTEETRGLLNREAFGLMKESAIVVNTARGAIVDEADLVDAIEAGRIAGAAVDVLDGEPPAADHPFLRLARRPDFIVTPHVAWASAEAMQALIDRTIDNIEAFAGGAPHNVV